MDTKQKGRWWQAPSEQGRKEVTTWVPFTCQLSYNPLHNRLHASQSEHTPQEGDYLFIICVLIARQIKYYLLFTCDQTLPASDQHKAINTHLLTEQTNECANN